MIPAERASGAHEHGPRRPGKRRQRFHLAAVLFAVHPAVSRREQRLRAVPVVWKGADAKTAHGRHRPSVDAYAPQRRLGRVHHRQRVVPPGARQQQRELVAAQARRRAAGAARRRKRGARRPQHVVAELVAECVVQCLEAIEVGHDQADRPRLARRRPDLLFDALVEGAEVQQPRQRVALRHVPQLVREAVYLGQAPLQDVGVPDP
jgi:hypothetical protein